MGRVNLQNLEKLEQLPSKVGTGKGLLKPFGGALKSGWDKHRHGEQWYKVRHQIMRNSIGKNWDEIVKMILEKIPKGFAQEHSWIIERPHVMIQNSVTGYWHWQDKDGELSTYGYENPTKLKHSGPPRYNKGYYLDSQNRLKWIKDKLKTYKRTLPNKSEAREEKTFENLVHFLANKADYYYKCHKYGPNTAFKWHEKFDSYTSVPQITFNHPTKVDMVKRYDKATDSWIETGETRPSRITLSIDQFKLWCNTNNKTYFIKVDHVYHTNLKWSFKQ